MKSDCPYHPLQTVKVENDFGEIFHGIIQAVWPTGTPGVWRVLFETLEGQSWNVYTNTHEVTVTGSVPVPA